MAAVGFESTPRQRLVPKTSALDHSATLPVDLFALTKCYRQKEEWKFPLKAQCYLLIGI